MRYLILPLLLLPLIATAAPVQFKFKWEKVVTRENGDALASGELVGYDLAFDVAGGRKGEMRITGDWSTTAAPILDLPASYQVTWTLVAVDKNGVKSRLSAPVVLSSSITAPTELMQCKAALAACEVRLGK